ncbi:hypothetical protein GCM10009665_54240 [Kitasatospora nipponensis]|uniref:Tetratricopeptide repeat protein n=1 Tax=Kitasatospora nipponensis TaxID=258049 RepID=A0ABN1WUF8_9ACTN
MTPDEAVVPLFGEPFDSGLALAERHQLSADPAAAQACYEHLLGVAESLDDSPDVRYLRAHLSANLGVVQLDGPDPRGAEIRLEAALDLLRGIESAPMGPRGRQLWLDDLLKALLGRAELLRDRGDLDAASVCLEEAARRLPEFTGDGTRAAELGHHRVLLLIARSEWGAAEELASAVLATTPASVPSVPSQLLAALGLICASTGRFDQAEDYLLRAQEGFEAAGETARQQQLIAQRAYAALRGGELDRAERLFAEASAIFERQRQFGDLAVCEQARGFLAAARGDPAGAAALTELSLARFEERGASIAAADTLLLAAQQAYGRGDIVAMRSLCEQARAIHEAQGVYERCAQADLLVAAGIEESLHRQARHHQAPQDPASRDAAPRDAAPRDAAPRDAAPNDPAGGGPERAAVDAALGLALPAALALEAARYDFASGHARSQWLELAEGAMQLVFRLVMRRQDQGLLFELVEHRCAGASLTLGPGAAQAAPPAHPSPPHSWSPSQPPSPPHSSPRLDPALFPDGAMRVHGHLDGPAALGATVAAAAASVGLRVAPPPRVLMSPGSERTALQEYVEAAESRYHRRIVSDEGVPSWPTTS